LQRGISDFNKGYQPRTNIVKVEKGDLVTDSHSILAGWRKHFSQMFNAHGINGVRHREIHIAEPSTFGSEKANEKIKRHKLLGIDQIPEKLIKAWVRMIRSEIHKLINSIWNKEELPEEWKESIIVPM
jgi:predicted site-specific integrase-resolvase